MNYLYNGKGPFPGLPERNKETHPNAVITSAMSGALVLLAVGTLYYKTLNPGNYVFLFKDSITYRAKNGEWVLYGDGTYHENRAIASPDEENSGFVVWTDTDILSQSGSVWLPASDPVPVPQLNPAALMQGFATMLSLRK